MLFNQLGENVMTINMIEDVGTVCVDLLHKHSLSKIIMLVFTADKIRCIGVGDPQETEKILDAALLRRSCDGYGIDRD